MYSTGLVIVHNRSDRSIDSRDTDVDMNFRILYLWVRSVHRILDSVVERVDVPSFGRVGAPNDIPHLNDSTFHGKVEFIAEVGRADESTIDPAASRIAFVLASTVGD